MTKRISVIVVSPPSRNLHKLTASIDAQTMTYDDFDVTYITADAALAERLRKMAAVRPNVTVVVDEDPNAAGEAAVRGSAAEWSLLLDIDTTGPAARLQPQALDRMIELGEREQLDWVAGRVFRPADGPQESWFTEDEVVSADLDRVDWPAGGTACVLRRQAADNSTVDPVVARGGRVGAYPCLAAGPTSTGSRPAVPNLVIDGADARWIDGGLYVAARGVLSAPLSASSSLPSNGGWSVQLSICQSNAGLEFWLPSESDVDQDIFRVTAKMDLDTICAGEPLGSGVWELCIGAINGEHRGRRLRLQTVLDSGRVAGSTLVTTSVAEGLVIDVGATRHPLSTTGDRADVTLAETAAGTLLTLRVPTLEVARDSRVPGFVLLDQFPLPAVLIGERGEGRIECWLSGLPGVQPLSTKFGAAKPASTGLTLEITATGEMRVFPTPPAATTSTSPVPSSRIPPTRGREGPPTPRLQVLRRRVPAFLEPAARRLAENEAARRAYRKLVRVLR